MTRVVVVSKDKGRYKLVKTMGSSSDPQEIDNLSRQGEEWIRRKSGMADMFTYAEGKDREYDLCKTGFSKEGRHKNPQIILGLLEK